LYFDTGLTKPNGAKVYKRLPDVSDPAFAGAYAAAMGQKTKARLRAERMTVAKLIDLYELSQDFRALAASSQRGYGFALNDIRQAMGNAPVDDVEPRDVAGMMDRMGDRPGKANIALAVVGALYKWGRRRQHVQRTTNPTADIAPLKMGEHEPWPQHVIDAALACDNDIVRLAVHLLLYTGQRIGDVTKMRWSDIRGGRVEVRQQKTGKQLVIHIHADLAAELARAPRRGLAIITSATGQPYSTERLRQMMQSWALAETGKKIVPHGLRKNAVNALLEAECSVAEVSAITGQSLQMVEHYASRRNQGQLSASAILKWERKS
jgi:integrase